MAKKAQLGTIFGILISLLVLFLIFSFILKAVLPGIESAKNKSNYVSDEDFGKTTKTIISQKDIPKYLNDTNISSPYLKT